MDVKYIVSDWEKTKQGIGDLIGLGVWGKGMIDDLKKMSNNLEDAESLIRKYDSDGYVSFQHTSQESKYQQLFNDFKEMHTFTGQVGAIVDDVIDQRFYEDIDAFIESIRNLQIEDCKTTNRIGATIKINTDYAPSGEVPKQEITLNDLFAGDNFYAGQIKLEYDQIKEMNPDQDFSLEDYQQYALNTHAFEYHSIKDQQYNKEFWVNIAALVVIVGATLICPPAGIALGAVYGTLEITSAVSGKDWVSGREIDTGERWFRGLLAPLDIIPGVGAAKKFVTLNRVNQLHNAVDLGLKTARAGTPLKVTVGKVVDTAKTEGLKRLNQAKQAAVNKLKKDWNDAKLMAKEASDKADEGARGLGKYIFPNQQDDLALAGTGGNYMHMEASGNIFRGTGTAERSIGNSKDIRNIKIPSVRNNEFNKWFDNLSVKEFEQMWNIPELRRKIEDRIRRPGGYHEWHLVARTPKFKQWGISMDDIKEMRSLTKDVEFVNPPGRHGGRGSTKAHNEIIKIIDSANDYESFVKGLNDWAKRRMKNGIMDLPEGLRR